MRPSPCLQEAARGVLKSITEACEGLMDSWEKLRSANGNSRTLSRNLGAEVQDMERVEWLMPAISQKGSIAERLMWLSAACRRL